MSAVSDAPRHRFSREQYERMTEAGVFGPDDRLELLEGEIIDMSPQKSRHATAVTLVADALRALAGPDATIRTQLPFVLDDWSEPEPDIAVVPGTARDYRDAHPSRALLVVEVSDTTLAYDRGRKLAAYARGGVPEYWVLDLTAERVEVLRRPEGERYLDQRVVGREDSVQPLLIGDRDIPVGDLLP